MKQKSIRVKISSSIALIVLFTVGLISFLSNYFINKQFTAYITRQQEQKAELISTGLSDQYIAKTNEWNQDYIHAIGMYSLYEGYIIKVYDSKGNLIWDARSHDMKLCDQIMEDITVRMQEKYPRLDSRMKSITYQLKQDNNSIGSVQISYIGPFFLSDNDFRFLDSLNKILLSIGIISVFASILIGLMLAKRISSPILKTVDMTKQIADGNYGVRLKEGSDTKELTMLINSINHLAVSLETLEKLRKQMTEDVAHELRTPITIIQSHIEAMMEGIWEPTTERLGSCYDEVVRIGKLVSDLEQLAKLEMNNINLDKGEVDLRDQIMKMIQLFEPHITDKKLNVHVSGKVPKLDADSDRIRQVITNLLSNAIKYSKENGTITFELFKSDDMAGFKIRDNGIGIPEEELPYIFERFYRADKSRNRLTGGTGIGLTIVKSIIEAHQGTITVESKLNHGTCFTVLLPIGKKA